jgi:hypothetical protein
MEWASTLKFDPENEAGDGGTIRSPRTAGGDWGWGWGMPAAEDRVPSIRGNTELASQPARRAARLTYAPRRNAGSKGETQPTPLRDEIRSHASTGPRPVRGDQAHPCNSLPLRSDATAIPAQGDHLYTVTGTSGGCGAWTR